MEKNIYILEGKHLFYKRTDGSYILTGAYFSDPEFKTPILPKKWQFDEKIEVDASELKEVYLEQCQIKNGNLFKDLNWQSCLMPPFLIKEKHLVRCNTKLDEELAKDSPDPIKTAKIQREKEKCSTWSEKQWYEQAKAYIIEENINKPVILEKLTQKIQELP